MIIIQIDEGYDRDNGVGVHNVVTKWDDLLKKEGHTTEIVASIYDLMIQKIDHNDTIIIYHAFNGVHPYIRSLKCKKILVFHNITEPELLNDMEPEVSDFCAKGLYEISRTSEYFDYAVAFSEYSKRCLLKYGWDEDSVSTIPIMLRFDQYKRKPSSETEKMYSGKKTNILFSGRIFPNKRQQDVISVFATYKQKYNANARLFLVGQIHSKRYYYALCDWAKKLGVQDDVVFTGHTSFDEYLAYFKMADLFLCMSAHEGFCMPLVEAMLYEVPIIAYKSTAIPDTLGNAGEQIDDRNPETIAKKIDEIISSKDRRASIIGRQRERLRKLSGENLEKEYSVLFKMILKKIQVAASKEICDVNEIDKESGFLDSDCLYRMIENNSFEGWSGEIVIYGNGMMGKRISKKITKEKKEAALYICDSSVIEENDVFLLNPDNAVRLHKDAMYIVSVQNPKARMEILLKLGELHVKAEQICMYDFKTDSVRFGIY